MPLERIVQMGLGVGRTKLFYCVAWKMAHQVMAIGRITVPTFAKLDIAP